MHQAAPGQSVAPAPRSCCHSRAANSACSTDVSCQPPRSSVAPRSFAALLCEEGGNMVVCWNMAPNRSAEERRGAARRWRYCAAAPPALCCHRASRAPPVSITVESKQPGAQAAELRHPPAHLRRQARVLRGAQDGLITGNVGNSRLPSVPSGLASCGSSPHAAPRHSPGTYTSWECSMHENLRTCPKHRCQARRRRHRRPTHYADWSTSQNA